MGARECLFWVAAFSVSEKLPCRFKVLHVKVTRVSVEKYSQRYSDIFQEEGAAPPSISERGELRSQAPGRHFLLKDKFC